MTDWNSLVLEHKQLVWRTCYRLVGNHVDALDCFQETFLEAVKVERKKTVHDWPSLLRHLATVRALDLLRVRYRQRGRIEPMIDPSDTASRCPNPRHEAEADELAQSLRTAIAELPPRQAEAFCLCRLEGWSYREAANRMAMDTNRVGVLLHRACSELQRRLTSEGVDLDISK